MNGLAKGRAKGRADGQICADGLIRCCVGSPCFFPFFPADLSEGGKETSGFAFFVYGFLLEGRLLVMCRWLFGDSGGGRPFSSVFQTPASTDDGLSFSSAFRPCSFLVAVLLAAGCDRIISHGCRIPVFAVRSRADPCVSYHRFHSSGKVPWKNFSFFHRKR